MTDRTAKPTRLEDGDELDEFVAGNDVALIEFYTKGCARCQAMEPVLGNVARAADVAVGLLNPGDDLSLVDRFDIRAVPTLVLFEGGSEIARTDEGFQGTDAVVSFVDEHVSTTVRTV
jgi:thioredoxin 1